MLAKQAFLDKVVFGSFIKGGTAFTKVNGGNSIIFITRLSCGGGQLASTSSPPPLNATLLYHLEGILRCEMGWRVEFYTCGKN